MASNLPLSQGQAVPMAISVDAVDTTPNGY